MAVYQQNGLPLYDLVACHDDEARRLRRARRFAGATDYTTPSAEGVFVACLIGVSRKYQLESPSGDVTAKQTRNLCDLPALNKTRP
jgi:hypothetical protein